MLKRVGKQLIILIMIQDFFNNVAKHALLQILNVVLYILRLPFDLWIKAITRLAQQNNNEFMKLSSITGPWPFFSFIKRLCFEFIFDAVAVLSYPLGALLAIYYFFDNLITPIANGFFSIDLIGVVFLSFIGELIFIYTIPIYMAGIHDLLQFIMLPIRKLISWFRKPAQQLDIDVKNRG